MTRAFDWSSPGSSPHTRGARHDVVVWLVHVGIIPAYAGSTHGRGFRRQSRRDHPRIRGEHRGRARVYPISSRIIPAYAGSTCPRTFQTLDSRDHPRIRGEHVDYAAEISEWKGSSPHTRGAPQGRRRLARLGRIIPAYAGSTTPSWKVTGNPADHPRIRGEHPIAVHMKAYGTGSSPHTRGARTVVGCWRRRRRIIPAYAGSTTACPSPSGAERDHPRIRGEHDPEDPLAMIDAGSSPHTRGARKAGLLK